MSFIRVDENFALPHPALTCLPIKAPVLNRLGNMLLMNCGTAVKISNGAGYLEDAGVGAGGESEPVSDKLQHPVAAGIQFAVFLDKAGCHLGVAVNLCTLEALQLQFA